MSATQELLHKWSRQEELRLELTNVPLADKVSGNTGQARQLLRTLTAAATLRAHPDLSISVDGFPIETLMAHVTILFDPDTSLFSGEKDGAFGGVRYLKPGEDEGELFLELVLPIEFRQWFTDRSHLPVVAVELEGFTATRENAKQWDTEKDHLRVIQCTVVDQSSIKGRALKRRIEDLRSEAATPRRPLQTPPPVARSKSPT